MADVLFGDVEWTLKGPAIKRQYLTLSNTGSLDRPKCTKGAELTDVLQESAAWKLLEMVFPLEGKTARQLLCWGIQLTR